MRVTISLSIAVLFTLLLVGCRAELRSEVSLSQLQDESVREIPARLRVEVITCEDLQDSRNPSRWLIEAQEVVGRMFPGALPVECYSEDFDDWAVFSLPLAIDRDGDPSTFPSQDTFSLRSTAQTPLRVAVPRPVFRRGESELEQAIAPRFSSAGVTLNVRNDTGETFETWVLASWVDGEPLGAGIIRIPSGQSAELELSDVLTREAWDTGESTVLERGCDAAAGEDCQDALSAQGRGVPVSVNAGPVGEAQERLSLRRSKHPLPLHFGQERPSGRVQHQVHTDSAPSREFVNREALHGLQKAGDGVQRVGSLLGDEGIHRQAYRISIHG